MRDPVSAVDQIITEAQNEGKFADLRGKGEPLVIDTSPDAVIKGLLKEADVSLTPEWIALAGEIDRLLEQEQQLLQSYAAAAAAEQEALLGSERPPTAPAVGSGPAAPDERGRRGWRALGARFAKRRGEPPAQTRRGEPAAAAFQRRWDETLERYAALLHELNRKIRRFNQIVPLAHRQRALLPVRERLEAFTDRFPRLARAADGTLEPERGHVPASLLSPPSQAQGAVTRKRDALEVLALKRALQGARKPPPIG